MNSRTEQNCPLCKESADFGTFDNGQRKSFSCPSCGEFIITITAERMLSKTPDKTVLARVKNAPNGTIAEIRRGTSPSDSKQIDVKFLPRNSVPLP